MQARQAGSKGWVLWLQWLLANVVGRGLGFGIGALAGALVSTLYNLLDHVFPGTILDTAMQFAMLGLAGAGYGLGIGIAQHVVLRRRLAQIRWWIPASVVSWGLGGFIIQAVISSRCQIGTCNTGEWLDAMDLGLITGLMTGGILFVMGQWLILRRQICRSGWWLLTVFGETMPWLAIPPGLIREFQIWTAFWLAVLAILPGILLVWLLRHPIPQRRDFW